MDLQTKHYMIMCFVAGITLICFGNYKENRRPMVAGGDGCIYAYLGLLMVAASLVYFALRLINVFWDKM